MKEPTLEPLKQMAASIAEASSQEKIASLSRAFELFSHETERIENAYNSLKEEFTAIHQELEETNSRLKKKVAELDVITSYMKNILSNISQGLLFIDLNGDVTTYTIFAERLFGLPEANILYRNYWKNFDDDAFGFSMRNALATKNAPSLAYTEIKTKDGNKRDLEITANFVIEQEKKNQGDDLIVRRMEGVIVLVRDITDIRSLELIAKRADRMKELGELAASVAHEIRNPLGGIKGFASLLLRDLENNPEKKLYAEYIIQGADTLNHLVTSILDYSKPIQLRHQPISLQSLIKEVIETAKADTNLSKMIHFVMNMPEEEIKLSADIDRMKTAFRNLIVNALQAMPKEGTLTVNLSVSDSIDIEIEDTGKGISKEHLEKLFTPFFTTKSEGHGFGLAEVLKTVQAHGGDIKVESELNKGSVFLIKLPKHIRIN